MLEDPPSKRFKKSTNGADSAHVKDLCPSESHCEFLKESDVGIDAFLSENTTKIECTLKNRWEDFLVREVLGGHVARLTNLEPIVDESNNTDEQSSENARELLGPHLEALTALSNGTATSTVEIKAPDSKVERTAIHAAVRALFPTLTSTTLTQNGVQLIMVASSKSKTGAPKRSNTRMPPGLPYCRFVLYKEGIDTLNAISVLSRRLHLSPSCFTYAGTKDRRAITTQFITVKNIESRLLASVNKVLRGMRVGNFCYIAKPLFLGDLEGNQFNIVLRSVCASDTVIENGVNALKQYGFINYYGLQRFGHSVKCKSFEIGKHLIRGDWTSAIDLILTPTDADLPAIRHIKEQYLQTGDATECASKAPASIERYLFQGVAKHGKTLNALHMLPRNLRQLYVHSYQSLVWNRVATRRIRELGVQGYHAQPGDLYISDIVNQYLDDVDEVCETETEVAGNISRQTLPTPKLATADNCHQIPLTNVVLPLPGFDVLFPNNACQELYTELLKEDGLVMEDMRHRVKDFNLPGSYRPLVVVPKDVDYQIVTYSDPNIALIKSDLELIESAKEQSVDNTKPSVNSATDHPHRALILQFTLPKSSYATMAIRELAKCVYERR